MPSDAGATPATVRLPVAVLAVVAALVAALLAVWGATSLGAERLPTGPPRDPPSPPPAATDFTVDGLKVRFQEFEIRLAGPPFECGQAKAPPAPAFPAFVVCNHVVHADYDGAGHDWVAANGVALLDDSVVRPDLADTAEATFQAFYALSFSADDSPRVSKVSRKAFAVAAPAGSSASYAANVSIEQKGLETPYDRVVIIVVKLQSGRHAAFFSDFPHDGGEAALKAVSASAATISARV